MKRSAFTLLELIVVLAIIAILSLVVSVKVSGLVQEERQVRIEADLALLYTAGEQFLHAYPEETANDQHTLVAKHLLRKAVESPMREYDYVFIVSKERLYVALEKEGQVYTHGDFVAKKQTSRIFTP